MTNYANPDSVGAPFHLYSQVSVAGDLVSVAGQVYLIDAGRVAITRDADGDARRRSAATRPA